MKHLHAQQLLLIIDRQLPLALHGDGDLPKFGLWCAAVHSRMNMPPPIKQINRGSHGLVPPAGTLTCGQDKYCWHSMCAGLGAQPQLSPSAAGSTQPAHQPQDGSSVQRGLPAKGVAMRRQQLPAQEIGGTAASAANTAAGGSATDAAPLPAAPPLPASGGGSGSGRRGGAAATAGYRGGQHHRPGWHGSHAATERGGSAGAVEARHQAAHVLCRLGAHPGTEAAAAPA